MDEDDDCHSDESLRIDRLIAVLHAEGKDKERDRGEPHQQAEDVVEHS